MAKDKQKYTKQELRLWAKEIRRGKDFAVLNQQIVQNIKSLNIYKSAKNIMLFYPLANEINLLELLNDEKSFSFPCIKDENIVPYKAGKEFQKGAFGVFEPTGTEKQDISELDLVIVPALCADKNGYRIGYGKGYYDRFIKTLDRSRTKLLTPVYSSLLVEDIFAEPFDEKIDFIVTEIQL